MSGDRLGGESLPFCYRICSGWMRLLLVCCVITGDDRDELGGTPTEENYIPKRNRD